MSFDRQPDVFSGSGRRSSLSDVLGYVVVAALCAWTALDLYFHITRNVCIGPVAVSLWFNKTLFFEYGAIAIPISILMAVVGLVLAVALRRKGVAWRVKPFFIVAACVSLAMYWWVHAHDI